MSDLADKLKALKDRLGGRAPTVDELVEATGLSAKIVKSVFKGEIVQDRKRRKEEASGEPTGKKLKPTELAETIGSSDLREDGEETEEEEEDSEEEEEEEPLPMKRPAGKGKTQSCCQILAKTKAQAQGVSCESQVGGIRFGCRRSCGAFIFISTQMSLAGIKSKGAEKPVEDGKPAEDEPKQAAGDEPKGPQEAEKPAGDESENAEKPAADAAKDWTFLRKCIFNVLA